MNKYKNDSVTPLAGAWIESLRKVRLAKVGKKFKRKTVIFKSKL